MKKKFVGNVIFGALSATLESALESAKGKSPTTCFPPNGCFPPFCARWHGRSPAGFFPRGHPLHSAKRVDCHGGAMGTSGRPRAPKGAPGRRPWIWNFSLMKVNDNAETLYNIGGTARSWDPAYGGAPGASCGTFSWPRVAFRAPE